MAIVWLVERNIHNNDSIHTYLAGNFPVRVISSISSLHNIAKIEKKLQPDILIIKDTNSFEQYHFAIEHILYKSSACNIVIIDPNACVMQKLLSKNRVYWLTNDQELPNIIFEITNNGEVNRTKSEQTTRFKDISYDKKNMALIFHPDDVREKLPLKEAMLLDFFLENHSECVTREQIQKYIWSDTKVNSRTIDSHISRLRKKIAHREVRIDSIYGGGYILK